MILSVFTLLLPQVAFSQADSCILLEKDFKAMKGKIEVVQVPGTSDTYDLVLSLGDPESPIERANRVEIDLLLAAPVPLTADVALRNGQGWLNADGFATWDIQIAPNRQSVHVSIDRPECDFIGGSGYLGTVRMGGAATSPEGELLVADGGIVVIEVTVGVRRAPFSRVDRQSFSASPNPFSDRLSIQCHDPRFTLVELWNSSGRKLWESRLSAGRVLAMETSQLAKGMYFVRFSGKSIAPHTVKVIRE